MASTGKDNLYQRPDSRSAQLYRRASTVMSGGNTRQTVYTAPYPFYVRRGRGCIVEDEDGQERVDSVNNMASLPLGHANPRVVEAVVAQAQNGSCFAGPTESRSQRRNTLRVQG